MIATGNHGDFDSLRAAQRPYLRAIDNRPYLRAIDNRPYRCGGRRRAINNRPYGCGGWLRVRYGGRGGY